MSGTGRAPGRAGGNGQAPRSAGKPRAPGAGGARYAPADTGAEMGQPQQQNNQKINEVNEKLATVRTVMTENMREATEKRQHRSEEHAHAMRRDATVGGSASGAAKFVSTGVRLPHTSYLLLRRPSLLFVHREGP